LKLLIYSQNNFDKMNIAWHHRSGSVLAEQWKKVDLAGNLAARQRPEQEVFLQPTDAVTNVGTMSGGRGGNE
jgi:hypothetical protein